MKLAIAVGCLLLSSSAIGQSIQEPMPIPEPLRTNILRSCLVENSMSATFCECVIAIRQITKMEEFKANFKTVVAFCKQQEADMFELGRRSL